MKNSFLLIALTLITLLSGCLKDQSLFIPDDGPTYKSDILGIVNDENNQPVEGAVVTFNGQTKITDENGVYIFKSVNVSSKHSFLKIRKNGYFEASRAFNTRKEASIKLVNTLLAKSFNHSFPATSGGNIGTNEYILSFPANAIVLESSGATYSGSVKVAVQYLDPSKQTTFESMPGNLMGFTTNNELQSLTTFGMLYVELQSSTGEKLQIEPGKQVSMSATIPKTMLSNAPSTIPLWYFDESIGYWKEEGFATLNQQTGMYTGNVTHFSCWNYDDPSPSINVSGKVVDQNGSPVQCYISFKSNGLGGGGYTNIDGTYSGPIAKDKVLELTLNAYQNNCASTVVYTQQVGPFSADVVLPDITINSPLIETFSFTANTIDCNNDPVQTGYIKVIEGGYVHMFNIVNGQSAGSFLTCSPTINAFISAINLADHKESNQINVSGPGPHSLGTIQACGNIADYFSIMNSNLGLNITKFYYTVTDSLQDKSFWVPYDSTQMILEAFGFTYDDNSPTQFAAGGPFPIKNAFVYVLPNQKGYYLGNGSGSVTITSGGTTGDNLIGSYTVTMQEYGTTNYETFTGSFKWTIQ